MAGWIRVLLAPATYSILTVLLYVHGLALPLQGDVFEWINGQTFGNPPRHAQHVLQHVILQPLLGDQLWAYRAASMALHVVNACLVHALFVALFRRGSTLERSPALLQCGALCAGVVFVSFDSGAVTWIAAMSYQLVTLFSLATLLLTALSVRADRRRAPLIWVAVVLSAALAMASHIYAAGLVAMVAVVEMGLRRRSPAHPPRRVLVRYLALAAVPAVYAAAYFPILGSTAGDMLERESVSRLLLSYTQYLWFVGVQFATGVVPEVSRTGALEPIALSLCVVVLVAGAWQWLHRDKPIGPLAVIAVFGLLWTAATFLQTFEAGGRFVGGWRYYFPAVGFAFVNGYLVADGLRRIAATGRRPLFAVAAGGILGIAIVAGIALDVGRVRQRVHDGFDVVVGRARIQTRVELSRAGDAAQP